MGRSGTTIVMEMLASSGVYLDEVNWAQEHEDARAIDDAYLEHTYGARPGRPYGRLPREEIAMVPPDWHDRVGMFVAGMDERAAGRPWAVKDPRMTLLHDLWLPRLDVVIGVFRRPDDVVDSYLRQGWISGARKRRVVLGYWERFNQSLLHVLDTPSGLRRYLVEASPDLAVQLGAVLADLGLALSDQASQDFDGSRQSTADPAEIHRAHRPTFEQLIAHRSVRRGASHLAAAG